MTPSPPAGYRQQLTPLLQRRAPKRFSRTRTDRKERVADMWVMTKMCAKKKRCRYWFLFWRKDLIALPFAPPQNLSLLLSLTTWCPHQKPATWMEPCFKWSTNTSFGTATSSHWFHYPNFSWSWHSIPYNEQKQRGSHVAVWRLMGTAQTGASSQDPN